jgi:hypothetical protein
MHAKSLSKLKYVCLLIKGKKLFGSEVVIRDLGLIMRITRPNPHLSKYRNWILKNGDD